MCIATCAKFSGADPFLGRVWPPKRRSVLGPDRERAGGGASRCARRTIWVASHQSCTPAINACSPTDQPERALPPGVCVLSKEFVRSKAPVRELGPALWHWEANREGRALVPVFLAVSWEECKTMRQRYDDPGFWGGWEQPESAILDEWAADLKRLSGFTGLRCGQVQCAWRFRGCVARDRVTRPCDGQMWRMIGYAFCGLRWTSCHPSRISCAPAVVQTDHFDGALAARVLDAAIEQLKKLGRVQRTYSRTPQPGPPMTLHRLGRPLIGEDRRANVKAVIASLEQHGVAVVGGGPGEGKSSVAREAACQMWEADKCLGGAFGLDTAGENDMGLKGSRLFHHACMQGVRAHAN